MMISIGCAPSQQMESLVLLWAGHSMKAQSIWLRPVGESNQQQVQKQRRLAPALLAAVADNGTGQTSNSLS